MLIFSLTTLKLRELFAFNQTRKSIFIDKQETESIIIIDQLKELSTIQHNLPTFSKINDLTQTDETDEYEYVH